MFFSDLQIIFILFMYINHIDNYKNVFKITFTKSKEKLFLMPKCYDKVHVHSSQILPKFINVDNEFF